jgi:hypothetical protein
LESQGKKIYRLNKMFEEELITYFPLKPRGPHRKRHLQELLLPWNVCTKLLPSNNRGIHRQTHRHMHPTIPLLLYVFDVTGTCLPSHCLAMKGGIHFTKPLPSNDRGLHTQTQRLMSGAYEVCHSNGLRCSDIHTKFHKDWFMHSKVNRAGFTHTHTDSM